VKLVAQHARRKNRHASDLLGLESLTFIWKDDATFTVTVH